jgi:putative transcriptional regulator
MVIYLRQMLIYMNKKPINRIKAVLAEKGKTNKWLAEKLNKNETTVSRWCTNEVQPSMDTLVAISSILNIDVRELLFSTENNK